jgi:hypothetical protein
MNKRTWIAAFGAVTLTLSACSSEPPEDNESTELPDVNQAENDRDLQNEELEEADHSLEGAKQNQVSQNLPTAFLTDEEDEVGSTVAVANPDRVPLMSKQGTDFWNCSGLVNYELIDDVYHAMFAFSQESGMAAPKNTTCYFKREPSEMGGRQTIFYSMEFFVDEKMIKNVNTPNRTLYNWRQATFYPMKNGATLITLFLLDENGQNLKARCVDLKGRTIADENCLNMR